MQFHSALSTSRDLDEACSIVSDRILAAIDGPIDFACVFVTSAYGNALDRLPTNLHERLGVRALFGCTGAAVRTQHAAEAGEHGLVVIAGSMPNANVVTARVDNADLPSPDAPPAAWRALLRTTAGELQALIVLADPFQCDVRTLLAGLDFAWPDTPKVGGIASGSRHPQGNALFAGRERVGQGAVLVGITGDVRATAVVAQGCRPFGRTGRVTEADRNRLMSIDERPAREFVSAQLAELEEHDLRSAEGEPLFLGVASDPFAETDPAAGDFVVRNVFGIDDRGSLVIGDHLQVGRSVRLHLHDVQNSQREFAASITSAAAAPTAAALMFRCLARRGEDHATFRENAGDVPLAGCDCNGEIGPAGGGSQLHAYTAACLLLQQPTPGASQ